MTGASGRAAHPDGFSTELLVRAPVDRVWRALRDPAEIRRWHGWLEPGLDAEIQHIYVDGARAGQHPYELFIEPLDTFRLQEHEDGTRIRLDRAGREQAPEWADWYDDISQGWVAFLQQLRFALERHPGADRRTLFWVGSGEPTTPLLDDRALPTPTLGRWYHTDLQDGVVLDGLGPGLLVVARKDHALGGPSAMATLSTYGLHGDAEWDAVRTAWTAWFRAGYPDAEDPKE